MIFTVKETDADLYDWFDNIPARYRNLMLRMALLDAIRNGNGGADPEKYFSRTTSGPNKKPVKSQPGTSKMEAYQTEPKVMNQPKPKGRDESTRDAVTDTEAKGEEELVAFTLAHLPEGVSEDLRELATRFPREQPYSMDDLLTLKELVTCTEQGGNG
ncbi:hypothetical protein [Acidithiobacillus marinus]|uniref:hypothetical protein n=1 Tax=Acidithiobacillus marinus TaxID=187490 RepID=UPI00117A4927|nr:hypothetical protein [Acidithiobacillus marinus]